MAGETKARMVDGAVRLLATQGTQGTSFADVLELTGAPRGSIYHHFPDGKDQLLAAAVDLAGARALGAVDGWVGRSPEEVTASFLGLWHAVLERSGLRAGCAVLAVTVSTGSPELLEHTAAVFRAWRTSLAALFSAGGLPDDDAAGFAATLVAASEGAVVVSRAEQSMEPFELVAGQLLGLVRRLA
ncbi:TetR/AcrR family transcriptional regulator [Cellulomonas sp. McL0617]|uniref:TetR/AcrR family transcriptional regulator n=1 Tax=Cellulomonas sp. McL0617 TaxID=3415675 RepID=UPI003CE96CEF